MSTQKFNVTSHVLPATHIRGYFRTTAHETDVLRIAIRQYTPRSNPAPRDGDVTIIAAHANAVNKEMYEPMWDDLLVESERGGWRIRGIWIADVAGQGESGVLNEAILGDEVSWFDHPRDLFNLVNHFRDQMPPPLIGVGHSMGGNNIINLSLMHPRLFAGVVLIDPVTHVFKTWMGRQNVALLSAFRKDVWPSREVAEASFKKNPFYKMWDPRVLNIYFKYGLRELPTAVYPEYKPSASEKAKQTALLSAAGGSAAPSAIEAPSGKPVTLTTTKHQEVFYFHRGRFPEDQEPSDEALAKFDPPHRLYPDVSAEFEGSPIYRPDAYITFNNLPFLRPRTLFVFPTHSNLYAPGQSDELFNRAGTGVGGSGGAATGAVKQVAINKTSHFATFERPTVVAGEIAAWLKEELPRWKSERDADRAAWEADQKRYSGLRRMTMSPEYLKWMAFTREKQQSKL